ncbi:MAG: YlxM family DNA-binding protein [Firmicutes bacterium]|nr:YlxM family DNA-binding protein [Bacillota bacterium]
MSIEKTTRLNMLYDFYAVLLTDRQRELFESYYQFDLTLAEIAENLSISRQAVYDMLRRVISQLENYEQKLALLSKHQMRSELISELQTSLKAKSVDRELLTLAEKIKEL